jgi:hypothetical protein
MNQENCVHIHYDLICGIRTGHTAKEVGLNASVAKHLIADGLLIASIEWNSVKYAKLTEECIRILNELENGVIKKKK